MTEDISITTKIETQLERILEENTNIVSKEKIIEVLDIFKNLDTDMIPVLDIFKYAIENIENQKVSSVMIKKIIKFYGLGKEVDILETRQKISLVGNKLVKRPFLKKESIEMINILLQEFHIL